MNYFGRSQWEDNAGFVGQLDEVRVWKVARTAAQIRANMHNRLTGREENLVGLWNFDAGDAGDASRNGYHGQMHGAATCVPEELPTLDALKKPILISGQVRDTDGKALANTQIRLAHRGQTIRETVTDDKGSYALTLFPKHTVYDLAVTHGDKGDWLIGLRPAPGKLTRRNFVLKPSNRIQGRLLTFADTPHVNVPVSAVLLDTSFLKMKPPLKKEITQFTTLSDADGRFQLFNLKPGRYLIRCQVRGGYVYYGENATGTSSTRLISQSETSSGEIFNVNANTALEKIDFRFAPFKKGTWRTITRIDGLPSNQINDLHYSTDGFLWIATDMGVSRYDGLNFVNFNTSDGLKVNYVNTIHESADGTLWFGTRGGLSRYQTSPLQKAEDLPPQGERKPTARFVNFTTAEGLAHDVVSDIHETADFLWIGTEDGLSRYDGNAFTNFTVTDGWPSTNIAGLGEDLAGDLWIAVHRDVTRYDGLSFVNFSATDGLAVGAPRTIDCDTEGHLWFGGDGISVYDGQTFVHLTMNDGLIGRSVHEIKAAPDGVVWIGLSVVGAPFLGGGVSRYDGSTFVNFDTSDGLASNNVNAIELDDNGVVWVGTINGLSRYDESAINFTTKDGLIDNHVSALEEGTEGEIWVGTKHGVSRLETSEASPLSIIDMQNFTVADGLVNDSIQCIHRDAAGYIWLGTDDGLSRYDGHRFANLTIDSGLFSGPIRDITTSADGAIWLTTWNALSRYDGELSAAKSRQTGGLVNFSEGAGIGLASYWMYAIHRDARGAIWVGTDGGVSYLASPEKKRLDDIQFVTLTEKDGFVQDAVQREVMAIHSTEDGMMWFGTRGGVSRYDGKSFVNFTMADGLAFNEVWAIKEDPTGKLWFGTSGGVSLYDGTAFSTLDTRDGLTSNNVKAIYIAPTGDTWFGLFDGGLIRYRPLATKPRVRITKVEADELSTDLSRIRPIPIGNRITIRYAAIDLKTHPQKRQYLLKMSEQSSNGKNEQTHIAKQDYFNWTPQMSGTYTFSVQAIDRDLNYSQPARITLKVFTPWYKNAWATVPSVAGGITLITALFFFVWRSAVQRREAYRQLEVAKNEADAANRAKSAFLANMSHEIRTPMNAILGYTQILMSHADLHADIRRRLQTIDSSGNHLLALINDILDLSKIEAGAIELQNIDFDLTTLISGISTMLNIRCENKQLDWRVEWASHQADERIQVHGDEGKLRQVLINLLANAVKFTEAGEVMIRISESNPVESEVTFEVIDTGIGIPVDEQAEILKPFAQGEQGETEAGTGLGLAISDKLIEVMGGQLSVESEPGVGSRFFFSIPLLPATTEVVSTSVVAGSNTILASRCIYFMVT